MFTNALKTTSLIVCAVLLIWGLVALKSGLPSLRKKLDSTLSHQASVTAPANHKKFNAAVMALNRLGDPIAEEFENYAKTFDLDSGPTGREVWGKSVTGSTTFSEMIDLKSALTSQPGDQPLDQASRRYVETFDALRTVLGPADIYYAQQDYRDDHFAKGKAMHASIVAAYRANIKAARDLRNAIAAIELEQKSKRLAELKAKGEMRQYDTMLTLSQADDIVKFVEAELGAKKDIRKIDFETLGADNDKMDKSLGDLRQINDAEMNSANGNASAAAYALKSYVESAEQFLKESKSLQRSLRDNQPLERDSETGSPIEVPDLVKGYNRLVGRYNAFIQ